MYRRAMGRHCEGRIMNGSINVLRVEGAKWAVAAWGDVSHMSHMQGTCGNASGEGFGGGREEG